MNRGGVENTTLEAKAKDQRWSRGHKARGQGQGQGHKKNPRPRPRTAFPRTDAFEAKDRNARGQGQGPRTQSASALQKKKFFQAISKKKKKKVFTKIFQAISSKKRFPDNFSSAPQNFNIPKNSAVLEPRTGQFSRTWGLEAKAKDFTFEAKAKAKDFKLCPRGRPRGQGRPRGLHLCQGHKKIRGQGQGQEWSRLRPRTKDTAASVLQKKGLQKSFPDNLQFKGVARIFDWGGLNHKSHTMTSSKICLLFT